MTTEHPEIYGNCRVLPDINQNQINSQKYWTMCGSGWGENQDVAVCSMLGLTRAVGVIILDNVFKFVKNISILIIWIVVE